MQVVSQAADAKKDGAFLRKYRGSTYVLVVEVKRNSKGQKIDGEENKEGLC